MSKMSEFDAELRQSGIDPKMVDLWVIDAYRTTQRIETGRDLTIAEAAKELYKQVHTNSRCGN